MKAQHHFISYTFLIFTVLSCKDYVVMSPKNLQCSAPKLEENIVGVWNFESTYGERYELGMPKRKGIITFTKNGMIEDPDSLFENRVQDYVVTSKTYSPNIYHESGNFKGYIFKVYQKVSIGQVATLFTLVSNDCDKIHLRLFLTQDNGVSIILSRKK